MHGGNDRAVHIDRIAVDFNENDLITDSGAFDPEDINNFDEDCLFLDITVPRDTSDGDRKAVMVLIHGGGYMQDSSRAYIGAPLATHGDVIVVAIQYRLGVLGFLSEGPGGDAHFNLSWR